VTGFHVMQSRYITSDTAHVILIRISRTHDWSARVLEWGGEGRIRRKPVDICGYLRLSKNKCVNLQATEWITLQKHFVSKLALYTQVKIHTWLYGRL